ncbi:MAG: CbiX/SirB N-terminal domain-containing protein [Gammaproteobacteria bacterium]|nr:CbiX/SirB N-terminal domain-containing protein [Gammaproteobacteria bacterium]
MTDSDYTSSPTTTATPAATCATAVLVVAHGSRSEHSNAHFASLVQSLRDTLGEGYRVGHSFLEMAEPGIPAGLNALVEQGAQAILLLPYFLSPGRHVVEDVPGIVAEFSRSHPELNIEIAPYFGAQTTTVVEMLARVVQHELAE